MSAYSIYSLSITSFIDAAEYFAHAHAVVPYLSKGLGTRLE